MPIERREFLKTTGKAITVGAATLALGGKILGANDRVRVAICGVRGRGNDHIHGFTKVPGTELAAVCDVDESVSSKRISEIEKLGLAKPKSYVDVRKLLEDKDIDAISIATPNHWHSLMAIWGCQAGKDVYVEKPCSHNTFEGRQLVRAVKKYNRICQHGSQSRSNPGMVEATKHLTDGTIGDVYVARAICYKWRPTIGRAKEEAIPSGVNYDLWTGPAPMKPFTRNRFHYNWHWIWDTGNGEVGNQAMLPCISVCDGRTFHVRRRSGNAEYFECYVLFRWSRGQAQDDRGGSPPLDHQSRGGTRHGSLRGQRRAACWAHFPADQAGCRPSTTSRSQGREDKYRWQHLLRFKRIPGRRRIRRLQDLDNGSSGTGAVWEGRRRPLCEFH